MATLQQTYQTTSGDILSIQGPSLLIVKKEDDDSLVEGRSRTLTGMQN